MSEFKLRFKCADFEEWECIIYEDEFRIEKEGYRVRLTDNGIYKVGEIYGCIHQWTSKTAITAWAKVMAEEFQKSSIMGKMLNGSRA